MSFRVFRIGAGGFLIALAVAVNAQGVYVVQGENGPIFSNTPQPGAKEVKLRPLSVIPAEKVTTKSGEVPAKAGATAKPVDASPGQRRPDVGAGSYTAFRILSPEDGGAVIANNGFFEVRLEAEPSLQIGEGHAFVVRINGRSVAQRFTNNEFVIPPEFWADMPVAPNQSVQLDASIVDGAGQVLRQAAPVRVTMRVTTVLNRPHPLIPLVPHRHEAQDTKKKNEETSRDRGVSGTFIKH